MYWPQFQRRIDYQTAAAAIDWLCRSFGFEVRLKVEGDGGRIEHSELTFGAGLIMVAQEGPRAEVAYPRSPKTIGGYNTQSLMVLVDGDDTHCCQRAAACCRRWMITPILRSTTTAKTTGPTAATARPIRKGTTGGLPSASAIRRIDMSTPGLDQTLLALADPTRRRVVELLGKKPRRAGELAAALSVSSPRLSRHLRVPARAACLKTRALIIERARQPNNCVRSGFGIAARLAGRGRGFLDRRARGLQGARRAHQAKTVTLRPGTLAPSGDQATVSVVVAVDVADAFAVTGGNRSGGNAAAFLSWPSSGRLPWSGVGGRLFQTPWRPSSGAFEVGRVTAWEPPARLVLEWRNANFAPGERTEIEVLFEPAGGGTRVTVQHRGWAALRPDHPARHNLAGSAFSRMMGLWWGDQLTALRERAEWHHS